METLEQRILNKIEQNYDNAHGLLNGKMKFWFKDVVSEALAQQREHIKEDIRTDYLLLFRQYRHKYPNANFDDAIGLLLPSLTTKP